MQRGQRIQTISRKQTNTQTSQLQLLLQWKKKKKNTF